jgi:hypothetical protein
MKSRWRLAVKTVPYIVLIIIFKYLAHFYNVEFLSLNALFTALISSNIFLIGFLLSGTLSDFKESERLPSELASSIQAIADEAYITYKNKNSKVSFELLEDLVHLNQSILKWFYKKERTEEIYNQIFLLNDKFLLLESETQANFIVRMKNEQSSIRKIIKRIHTIRETSFLGTGYAIAELITFMLVVGLIFVNVNPFYESMFFVSFVSFIMIYMVYFIRDLDNPFSYYDEYSLVDEVPLKPLTDSLERIKSIVKKKLVPFSVSFAKVFNISFNSCFIERRSILMFYC